MKLFYAPSEDWIREELGTLAADATAGSNVTLTLMNNDGMMTSSRSAMRATSCASWGR
jgi:hypothetical protein